MQIRLKRIISFILALIMIFGMINSNLSTMSVFAEDLGDSPLLQDGFYQIETKENLKWFTQEVNSGKKSINAKLIADITLDSSSEWTPIGTSANKYAGIFDGNSKSISGLNIQTGTYKGLFGYIDIAGVVKELTITGSSVAGTQYIGLVAGTNAGNISGVTVDNSSVKGQQSVGGIAGQNTGTIIASENKGAVVTQDVYKDEGIAGIAGVNSGNISLSYNNADVTRSHTKSDYGYFGGITGNNTSTGIIDSCYNTGEIAGSYRSGGIAGINTKTIKNSYNIGTVNSGGTSTAVGAIFAYGSGGTSENCYYLNTSITKPNSYGTSKTDAEMKVITPSLGGAFENDLEISINEGYPILKWQNPEAVYTVTLTVSPKNTVISLTDVNGHSISADSSEDGVYIFNNVIAGTYQYSASCEEGDYDISTGSIIVSKLNVSKNINLIRRNYKAEFTVNPQDALVSVTAEGFNEFHNANNGSAVFMLPNGTYNYTVDKFGYSPQNGTITVNKASVTENVSLVQSAQYELTFDIDHDGASVTVTHPLGGVQSAETDGTYKLYNGTYNYRIKLLGYSTVKGTVTIDGSNKIETVGMTKNMPWTGNVATEFYGGSGTQSDPYQISNGEELAYLSSLISTPVTNAVYKNLYYKLVDDIDMGGTVNFTPIGTKISEGYYFAGNFDGYRHVISNLKVRRTESYAGLFGMVKDGTALSNIVLKNPLIETTGGTSSHAGGLVGYSSGSSKACIISNCAVIDGKINSESFNLGGLIGYASSTTVKESYAIVEINGTNTTSAYAGLLIGQCSGGTIEHSFARGKLTTSGKYTGGLIGSVVTYSTVNIKYSYVSGDVLASNINYGFVVGSVESGSKINATNCYYNPDVLLTGKDGATATNGFIATKQLKLDESLVLLNEGGEKYARLGLGERYINKGYPYLINTYYVTVEPEQLSVPTGIVWIDNTKAKWNSSENAIGYRLSLYKNDEKIFECNTDESTLEYNFTDEISINGNGLYSFTVKALGDNYFYYASAESNKSASYNAFVAGKNVTFNINLPYGESYYRENDPVITVIVGTSTVKFNAGEAKFLPRGNDYTYTINALGFKTISGVLSVDEEAVVIEKTLEPDTAWDGVSVLEPMQVEGVYQISSGYQLAWFRDEVNKTIKAGQSSNLSAKLVRDINLCGFEWAPIGTYTNSSATFGYTGTFDGDGHNINGLSITTGKDGSALFGYVYLNGIIKDLSVKGNISAGQYSAGIVGVSSAATISRCNNYVNVTVTKAGKNNIMVGGIVGSMTNYTYTTALTEYCVNYGNIIGGTTNGYVGGVVGNAGYGLGVKFCGNEGNVSGNDSVAGVVGRNSLIMTSCYNTGDVSGATTSIGGIAGFTNKLTKDCYNKGNISGQGKVGGIVGELHSEYGGIIEGSYNTGIITKSGTGANDTYGAIVGFKGGTSKTISKSYFLEDGIAGIGKNANDNDSAISLTELELKQFSTAALLGGTFARKENDYPLLRWQDSASKDVVVLFNVEPADAEIILKDESTKQIIDPVEGTNGYLLSSGEYKYKIKKENWQEVNKQLAVLDDNIVVDIVMNPSDTPVYNPIDVVLSVQTDSTGFLIARQVNEVSPSLAKSYGYTNDSNFVEEDEVSALDALVAAHIAIYGDNKDDINDVLAVNEYGFVTKVFGVNTSNFTFYVNGEQPNDGVAVEHPESGTQYTGYAITQTKLDDKDSVEFYFIQDASNGSDKYAWFDLAGAKTEAITVTAGKNFDIAIKGYMSIYGLNIPVERDEQTNPISGAAIVPVKLDSGVGLFGNPIAITNADGIAKITFNVAGTYILSAVNSTGASPLMSPWLVVTVEEAPPVYEPVTAKIRVQKDNTGFIIAQKEYEIMPGLAKSYGYTNDSSLIKDGEVSTLDALVAAHISVYGEDKAAINNALVVGSGGWITKMFGIITSSISFYVNGEQPNDGVPQTYPNYGTQYTGYSVSQAKLNNGDSVEFFVLQDESYMDIYTWFEANGSKVENLNLTIGENLDITVKGYMNWYGLNIPTERDAKTNPIKNAKIVPVVLNNNTDLGTFGTSIATTNNSGIAKLNFNQAGTYIISAVGNASSDSLMSPWLVVTVKDETPSGPDEDVLAVIELIDAIPQIVSLSDEQTVLEAKIAFDALSSEQKAQIEQSKQTKLLNAVKRITDLKIVSEVITLINALPAEVQLSDKIAVQNVRLAYNTLTNAQKLLIDKDILAKLLAAEAKIAELEGPVVTTPSAIQVKKILEKTAAYQFATVINPSNGSTGGEWTVLALARGGFITSEYKEIYLANLSAYVQEKKGILDESGGNYTEYSRVILALSSLEEDPSNFAGYNLLAPLAEFENVRKQGTNGVSYALIALNSNNYDIPLLPSETSYTQSTREILIEALLNAQLPDGGWAISSEMPNSTVDFTAMAIQALAPYYGENNKVTEALDRAIELLSRIQLATAGYGTAEADAQVIVALNALGISLTDEDFVKYGKTVYNDLMTFYISESGAFKHSTQGTSSAMATDQSMYALVSLYRSLIGANKLYDMTDAGEPIIHPEINKDLLNSTIADAEILIETEYTVESWSVFQIALSKAKEVSADEEATQAEINSANSALILAIDNLVKSSSSGGTTQKIVTFRLIGAKKHQGQPGYGSQTEYQNWIKTTGYIFTSEKISVYEVFTEILDQAGLSYVEKTRNYISKIQAPVGYGGEYLSEFDNGENSGWMFTVNGIHGDDGFRDAYVKDGDVIVWHYVDDYILETYYKGGIGKYPNGWLKIADTNPPTTPNPNTGGSTTGNVIELLATVKDGKATAYIEDKQINDAIKASEEKKENIVVIKPKSENISVLSMSVNITKKSIENVANADMELKIETFAGSVAFDKKAQNAIINSADGDAVTITIEQTKKERLNEEQQKIVGNYPVVDITVISKGKIISSMGLGKINISIPYELKADEKKELLTVWYIKDDGEMIQIPCTYNVNTKSVDFIVDHLSRYAVAYSLKNTLFKNPFKDINESDWFYDAIKYVVENNIMQGVDSDTFSPNTNVTRAMLVTMLYRYEKEPKIEDKANTFTDLTDEWYKNAVIWAHSNEIVKGYPDNLFKPNNSLTREQIVTILYRYAIYSGLDVSQKGDLSRYTDTNSITEWSYTAMQWAKASGIINGRTNTELAPKGMASRAEIATFIMRFIEELIKK